MFMLCFLVFFSEGQGSILYIKNSQVIKWPQKLTFGQFSSNFFSFFHPLFLSFFLFLRGWDTMPPLSTRRSFGTICKHYFLPSVLFRKTSFIQSFHRCQFELNLSIRFFTVFCDTNTSSGAWRDSSPSVFIVYMDSPYVHRNEMKNFFGRSSSLKLWPRSCAQCIRL